MLVSSTLRIFNIFSVNFFFALSEESVKRKVVEEDASDVPEKRAKTDDAEVVEPAEEVTA